MPVDLIEVERAFRTAQLDSLRSRKSFLGEISSVGGLPASEEAFAEHEAHVRRRAAELGLVQEDDPSPVDSLTVLRMALDLAAL